MSNMRLHIDKVVNYKLTVIIFVPLCLEHQQFVLESKSYFLFFLSQPIQTIICSIYKAQIVHCWTADLLQAVN